MLTGSFFTHVVIELGCTYVMLLMVPNRLLLAAIVGEVLCNHLRANLFRSGISMLLESRFDVDGGSTSACGVVSLFELCMRERWRKLTIGVRLNHFSLLLIDRFGVRLSISDFRTQFRCVWRDHVRLALS